MSRDHRGLCWCEHHRDTHHEGGACLGLHCDCPGFCDNNEKDARVWPKRAVVVEEEPAPETPRTWFGPWGGAKP